MERVLEPELMNDSLQAEAFARADFEEPHSAYPRLFCAEFSSFPLRASVLDLGCGPGDVTIRFAKAFPGYQFHAVDGAAAMLDQARLALRSQPEIAGRVGLVQGLLPRGTLPQESYDIILSCNLLHHLHHPNALWQTVRRFGREGTLVFVTDLFRPTSRAAAEEMVERYARGEPEVLRRDFLNSLLAAFTPAEIEKQLSENDLGCLTLKVISDRHVVISGKLQ